MGAARNTFRERITLFNNFILCCYKSLNHLKLKWASRVQSCFRFLIFYSQKLKTFYAIDAINGK